MSGYPGNEWARGYGLSGEQSEQSYSIRGYGQAPQPPPPRQPQQQQQTQPRAASLASDTGTYQVGSVPSMMNHPAAPAGAMFQSYNAPPPPQAMPFTQQQQQAQQQQHLAQQQQFSPYMSSRSTPSAASQQSPREQPLQQHPHPHLQRQQPMRQPYVGQRAATSMDQYAAPQQQPPPQAHQPQYPPQMTVYPQNTFQPSSHDQFSTYGQMPLDRQQPPPIPEHRPQQIQPQQPMQPQQVQPQMYSHPTSGYMSGVSEMSGPRYTGMQLPAAPSLQQQMSYANQAVASRGAPSSWSQQPRQEPAEQPSYMHSMFERQKKAKIASDAFHTADRDNSGFLDFKEFLDTLRSLNLSISYHHALQRFARMDLDKDGRINVQEFVKEYFYLLAEGGRYAM